MRKLFTTLIVSTVLLIFHLSSNNVMAQWTSIGPEGGRVKVLCQSSTNLYAVVGEWFSASQLFVSDDSGNSWSQVNSNSFPSDVRDMVSLGNYLFVGSGIGLFRSGDHGLTWVEIATGYSGTENYINHLAVSDTTLFAAGTTAGLIRSTNYGNTWEVTNTGLDDTFLYSLAANNSVIMAGTGDNLMGVYRSTDNGDTWQQVLNNMQYYLDGSYYDGYAPVITSLTFNGADVYAGTSESNGIWKTSDYGNTWVLTGIEATGFATVNALFALNGEVYAGSQGGGGVIKSTNDGTSWTYVNDGIDIHKTISSFKALGSSIFVGTSGGIYRTQNGGSTWVSSHHGISAQKSTNPSLCKIDSYVFYGSNSSGIFRTSDEGTSWTMVNSGLPIDDWDLNSLYSTPNTLSAFNSISKDLGDNWSPSTSAGSAGYMNSQPWIEHNSMLFCVKQMDAVGVYKSLDNGINWEPANNGIADPITSYLYSIHSYNSRLYLLSSSGVYVSNNDGATWVLGNFPGFTFWTLNANFYATDSVLFIGLSGSGGYRGIYRSIDNGANWTVVESNFSTKKIIANNNKIYVGGTVKVEITPGNFVEVNKIYFSDDWGTNWSDITGALQNPTLLAVNDSKIYVYTYKNNISGISASGNDGATWVNISGNLEGTLVSELFFINNKVWACTMGKSLMKRDLNDFEPPVQPIAINGATAPCSGSQQIYSVDSMGGVSYTWQLPAGWTVLSGAGTHSIKVVPNTTAGLILVTPSNEWGNGPIQFLTVNPIPSNVAQPGAIAGEASPIEGASYGYSVANQTGVTFTWSFPAGWTQTAGGSTNSVTVTAGASSGAISVVPSTTCGSNTASTLTVTPVLLSTLKPAAFDITGGGSYCGGSTGIEVGLSGTETGVDYRLYKNDTSLISTLAGTGSGISFGLQMQGTYKVIGENTYGTSSMNGTATISEIALATPSVSISADNTGVCSGIPVTLTATPLNGGTPSYQWYLNGSVTGTNNHQLSYTPTDGDSVYVVMTSDLSCTTTNPVQSNKIGFSVADVVAASVTISADNTEVCSGTEVTLTATPVNGGVPSYQWYINGTASGTGTEVFSYIPSDGDQVKVVMASSLACTSNSPATSNILAMQVTQIPSPTVSVAASSNPVCSGTGVTLTATPVDGGTPVYQWYLNGSAVGTGAGTYSYAPAEGDEVYVSMVSGLACAGTDPVQSNTVTIGLTDSFTASVSVAADNNPYCAGGQVKLTATPGNGGAASYQWYLNGSPVGLDTNTYVFSPIDGDEVYAELVSDLVCAIGNPAVSTTIILTETAVLPVSVSISADNTAVCSGTEVNFTAVPVNGGSPSYQWFVNGTAAGTDNPAFSYAPQDGDKIHVRLTSSLACTNGNPAQSDTLSVSVGEVLPVSVGISADNTSVCIGTQVTFTATPVNGGIPSYQWFVNGVAAGADSPEFVYTPADGDMVHAVATSSLACTSGNPAQSDKITVSVDEVIPVSVSIAADNTSVCGGTPVNFTATPVNGGTPVYQWYVNGTVAGTDSPAFSYAPQDGDKIHVRLTSGIACTSGNPAYSDTISVAVGEMLPVSVNIAADNTSVCSGTPVTFTATPVNGGSPSYQWFVNGENAGTDSPGFVYTPDFGDIVKVEMVSSLECVSNKTVISNIVSVNVIENVPVSVNIEADQTSVCSGTEVIYTATPINGGEPVYQWNVNGKLAGANTASYSYIPSNGDQVYVQVISSLVCTTGNPAKSNTLTQTVIKTQPVSIIITADNSSVCQGSIVSLTAYPVNGGTPSYKWFVNGNTVVNDASVYSYIPANGDNVKVVMTSDLTCTSGNPAESNIVSLSVQEILPVSVSLAASDESVCKGTSVTVQASAINGGQPIYLWTLNGAYTGYNSSQLTFAPVNGDKVKVKVTSDLECTTNNPAESGIIEFYVEDYPNVTWEVGNDTVLCIGDNGFEITGAQPEGGIYSGAGVAGGIFDPLVAGVGTYEIVYTYATSLGCTNQASATFTVDSCTSVSSVKFEDMVAIYPNPASDVLYVAINGEDAIKAVRVVTLLGKTVMEVKPAPAERMVKLPLNGLNHTLYFVEIILEDGMIVKQVVVK